MEVKITIFTPTYNRGYCIDNLYNSLIQQVNKNFIWLVIDDGSTDDTHSIIKNYIKENQIAIQYLTQPNSGKYVAINKAIEITQTELFFPVDSDDTISTNAVDTIIKEWTNIHNKNDYCGICFKKFDEGSKKHIGKMLPYEYVDCTIYEVINKYKIKGDKAEVFRTKEMKGKKFPVIEGEKLFSELYLWSEVCSNLKMRFFNKALYYCEYLPDGYTQNHTKLLYKNPTTFKLYYAKILKDNRWNLIMRLKALIRLMQIFIYTKTVRKKNNA